MINSNEVRARKNELEAVLEYVTKEERYHSDIQLFLASKIEAYDTLLKSEFVEQVKAPEKVLGNSREIDKESIKRVIIFVSKQIKRLQLRMADSLYVQASLGKKCLILTDKHPNEYLKLIKDLLIEMGLNMLDVDHNITVLRLEHVAQVNIESTDCFFIFSNVDSLSEMQRYKDFKESVKAHVHDIKITKPAYEFRNDQQIYLMHCNDSVWRYGANDLEKMHVANLD